MSVRPAFLPPLRAPMPAEAALTPAGRPPPPWPPPGRQHGRLPPACTAALALSRAPRPGRPPDLAPRPPPCLVLRSLQEQKGGPRSGGSGSVKHQPSAVCTHTNGLLSKTETDVENKLMVTLGENGGINEG